MPKPDVTTIVGRRLYYSHIDGDGWRSLSTVEAYRDHPTLSADVIFERAIAAYPELPVTVAPIAADLDPAWLGTAPAQAAARRIFAAAQVEAAHHTYSHPFAWGFFQHYDAKLEAELSIAGGYGRRQKRGPAGGEDPLLGYDSARAYSLHPFDLAGEMVGAGAYVARFLPPGKRVELVQWSGNTKPFAEAVRLADRAGLLNINGGDSRLDPEYPSVANVAAVGVEFEGVRQIYASTSNENTYTDLWSRRFFGFSFLDETLRRTDAPRRLLPHNVYYHMYSGEKTAALNALLQNLEAARAAEIAPVRTSDYVRIANGFFEARIERLGPASWRVLNRGALQTVRFAGGDRGIDYVRSRGVLGHRVVNGDLYVALDPEAEAPTVALAPAAPASRPYLAHARWPTEAFRTFEGGFGFRAAGFGAGAFQWRAVKDGVYRIEASRNGAPVWHGEARTDADGGLAFVVEADGIDGLDIRVIRRDLAQAGRDR